MMANEDDGGLEACENGNVMNGSVMANESVNRIRSQLSQNGVEVTFAYSESVIEESASSIFAFVEVESGTF